MFDEDLPVREYRERPDRESRSATYEFAAGIGLGTISLEFWYGFIGDSFRDAASEMDLYVDYPLQIVGYTIYNPELLAPVTTLAGAALLIDAGINYYG